jgi:hypothetical protein
MSSSDLQLDSPALVWKARFATFCTWKWTLRVELDAEIFDLNDRTTEVELDGVGLGAMDLRRAGTMDRVAERANMVYNFQLTDPSRSLESAMSVKKFLICSRCR